MSTLTLVNLNQHINQLPSLSTVITRLLQLLQSDNLDMSEIKKQLSSDQGLTTRILRIANSPFYGLSTHISDLQHACTLLGLNTLRGIVIAAGIMDHFPDRQTQGFNRDSFWYHAIGTGIAAKVLAKRCGLDTEQAFTAGLLHDMGKLVMATYFEQDFLRILKYREKQKCLIKDAERALLGFDHTVIGARVAEHWKLPKTLVAAIHFHHELPNKATPLAELVHIADILCRGLEIGNGGDDLIPILQTKTLSHLGLGWDDLQNALPEIEQLSGAAAGLLETCK